MTKEELGTLILNSERQLYSTAKTILINDQDCADAIQETIVKAFSKIGTLRNDKYAKTWLIRILINECYTLLRKSSKLVSLEGMSEMTEIETDQRTDYSDLYRAVNSLKEELRMPVILYYIEDFNIKEIAQILEITEGEFMGLEIADMEKYALSVSLMNVKSYGIAIIQPAEGSSEKVETALQNFIQTQQAAQEFYLQDQYEIAKDARLTQAADGSWVMVMCEDATAVNDSILNALK